MLRRTLAAEAASLTPEASSRSRRRESTAETELSPASGRGSKRGPSSARSKSRSIAVSSAILENHLAGKSSTEELIFELYHANLSLRTVDEIGAKLWGHALGSSAIGRLCGQVADEVQSWIERPLAARYPIVYLEGTELRWSGHYEERIVPILVAMGVTSAGYREILAVARGSRTETTDIAALARSLRQRGLEAANLFVGDYHSGFRAGLREAFPGAPFQACLVRFREFALNTTPAGSVHQVNQLLDEVHASTDAATARARLTLAAAKLDAAGQESIADLLRRAADVTLRLYDFPEPARPFISGNASLIASLRDVRERARTIGGFSEDATAVQLVAVRLRRRMRETWVRYRYGCQDLVRLMATTPRREASAV